MTGWLVESVTHSLTHSIPGSGSSETQRLLLILPPPPIFHEGETKKLKFTLEQATKAKRGSRELYSFFNLSARWGWVVNVTPRPLFPRERPGTHCIGGWVGSRGRSGRVRKILPPSGFDPQPVASCYTDYPIPARISMKEIWEMKSFRIELCKITPWKMKFTSLFDSKRCALVFHSVTPQQGPRGGGLYVHFDAAAHSVCA
jgi:hypothetical protein